MPPLYPLPRHRWQTTQDWNVELSDGSPLHIPQWYKFRPSVPRFLWAIYPPTGPAILYASCAHDRLYEFYELGITTYTRRYADDEWYHLMRRYGASWHRAMIGWVAIRTFGWTYWYF